MVTKAGAGGGPAAVGVVDETAAPRTRRERQRQATHDEIVSMARGLLSSPDGLTLRAVATAMGITPPALYRYVDSLQHLRTILAEAVFVELQAAIGQAYGRYGDDDPAAQILAAATAFRRWALDHPAEFQLVFASAGEDQHDTQDKQEQGSGEDEFCRFFGGIYERAWERYRFPIPTDDELGPDVLGALQQARAADQLPCEFPGRPLGLHWLFIRAWARLYGTVTLEVFKHMDEYVIASGGLFRSMLDDNAREMGFGDDWPRLQALIEEEIRRT